MADLPKTYHITHLENLAQIAQRGCLFSDSKRIELGLDCEIVGMSSIKQQRLTELTVTCQPPTKVGEYVPFYFCPRSIMLFILHKGNHPEVTYRGGQGPIIHLMADLKTSVEWANAEGRRWAFSDRNAGARYAGFYCSLEDLGKVNWMQWPTTTFESQRSRTGSRLNS